VKSAPADRPDGRGLRVAIVRARFNDAVVGGLLAGAQAALQEAGVGAEDLVVIEVPGAYELPLAVAVAAESRRYDAIVALGAVVRGETDHYEHIAREASAGLAAASREWRTPVGFGLLTVETEAQALARSAPGAENKGAEAARAALSMVAVLRKLKG
jgi:6,7-dimethyl-8-ribityllumazine synthase